MSTFRVTAEQLTIHPHHNADELELAEVGLYRAVVPKGQYRTGEWAVYIPEQAVLPTALIEELGLLGRLAGKQQDRVTAVRLRGELSQGIVCRPAAVLDAVPTLAGAGMAGMDFADLLGITKWEPEVPLNMAGELEKAPNMLPWLDVEDIKRYPATFTPGEHVVATEKIHGSCCCITVYCYGYAQVTSKGLGEQSLALVHDQRNLYWRAVMEHGVITAAFDMLDRLNAFKIGIFAEVFGAGVQDLHYGIETRDGRPGLRVFDIAMEDSHERARWLSQDEMVRALADATGDLKPVPRVYEGPYDVDLLFKLAEEPERVTGNASHLSEGLVVRPTVERYSPILGGRAIAKFKSPAYLTRKHGTEYS